jgi:hypothetical protein
MTRVDIEREILELLDEDLYGLWEIGWRLNTALGVDPATDPTESAAVVESLRQRHLVDVYVREWLDDSPRPIAVSGRSIDLATRSSWLVPEEGEPQFLLGSWTEERVDDA